MQVDYCGGSMTIEYNKPQGFDEWFVETLSNCIAKGIVEKAVRKLQAEHSKEKWPDLSQN